MRRARVSVTLPDAVRERLLNEARSRPESLDAHLGRLITAAAGMPEPRVVEKLRTARAEAAARARELGAARRRIRDLEARLNALHASGASASRPPLWSLDEESRSPAEREAWWRWLAAGVERLRERYEVVELGYDSHTHGRRWWWETAARLRAIAVAVAWDEALDRGGETVPDDPRYGEAFPGIPVAGAARRPHHRRSRPLLRDRGATPSGEGSLRDPPGVRRGDHASGERTQPSPASLRRRVASAVTSSVRAASAVAT